VPALSRTAAWIAASYSAVARVPQAARIAATRSAGISATGARISRTHGIALEIPQDLRPLIVALVEDKGPDALLYPTAKSENGLHDRGWVLDQVKRICNLAKVPEVTAHGMRGALATLTLERGVATHIVSQTLRHKDTRTTMGSYAEPGAAEKGARRKGLKLPAATQGSVRRL